MPARKSTRKQQKAAEKRRLKEREKLSEYMWMRHISKHFLDADIPPEMAADLVVHDLVKVSRVHCAK